MDLSPGLGAPPLAASAAGSRTPNQTSRSPQAAPVLCRVSLLLPFCNMAQVHGRLPCSSRLPSRVPFTTAEAVHLSVGLAFLREQTVSRPAQHSCLGCWGRAVLVPGEVLKSVRADCSAASPTSPHSPVCNHFTMLQDMAWIPQRFNSTLFICLFYF